MEAAAGCGGGRTMGLLLAVAVVLAACVRACHGATDTQDTSVLRALMDQWQNAPPTWGQSDDPCGDSPWEGVTCANNKVISIKLSTMGIKGVLAADIGQLSDLQSLDLSFNKDLGGVLTPTIGNLKQLTTLILAGCSFHGTIPDELGSVPKLSYMALNSNQFSGKIPASLGNLSNLYWFDIADNQLSGPLPISTSDGMGLDKLIKTKHFHFNKNQLSGPIPDALFSPEMTLIHLLFDGNKFTGSIPDSLGLVSTLEVVRLDRNSLSGPVPSNLKNLTKVNELNLANNQLTGTLPDLSGMGLLNYVDLSNNTFDPSPCPAWFWKLPQLSALIIQSGRLYGTVPARLFSDPQLNQVILDGNGFNGTLDMGRSISGELSLVSFKDNQFSSVTVTSSYNGTLALAGNPVCDRLPNTAYCNVTQRAASAPYSTSLVKCFSGSCQAGQSMSPQSCACAYPYQGIMYFRAPFFRDVGNDTAFQALESMLWAKLALTPGSVSLQDPFFNSDSYMQVQVKLFPSGGSAYFNRSEVMRIGFDLSNQTFKPPKESLLHAVMAKARKDLGLLLPASPTSVAAAGHAPFLQLPRQNSGRAGAPSPLSVSSPSSWAQAPVFSRSNSTSNGTAEDAAGGAGEELPSPVNGGAAPFYPQGGDALLDDLQLQEPLAFLNEGGVNPGHLLPGFDGGECWSPPGAGDGGGMLPFGLGWPNGGPVHRRSASVNELCLGGGGGGDGFGWKPCLYYARGFCKNGSSCRFVHGGLPDDAAALAATKMEAAADQQQCQDFLLRSKSQRLGSAAFPYSPTGSLPGSPSAASKCLSFLLQQQQQQQQHDRAAAAAALMLGGGGDDAHKFMGRPRLDRADFASMMNPASRQIYLTFPADSTFREEDVSNYFSIYGPVHDVRIPYQQKRMFGFVTFVYPETVKLILAKGNPHFICDARVLVKPYKEKGKVPDKYRKQQQGDFSGCTTPTGLDARDSFELHQLGGRILQHSNSANELLLRRKLEEQQQVAELQQAIELQSRRLMGLPLLDLKARTAATATISPLPTPIANAFASSQPASTTEVESPPESGEQLKLSGNFAPEGKVNGADKEESAGEASPNAADSDQSGEHNLPDSPFASPTKSSAFVHDSFIIPETEKGASGIVVDSGSTTGGVN